MSLEALLQNKPSEFELNGIKYHTKRYQTRDWDELKDVFKVVQVAIGSTDNPDLYVDQLLTTAYLESCVLLGCGSNMKAEEIIRMDATEFMTIFTLVIGTNADFFASASRTNAREVAALLKAPTMTRMQNSQKVQRS